MSTATQQASRERLTHCDFQRRQATEPQRAARRAMWGRSHTDGGINTTVDVSIPEARSDDERWCKRCERIRRVMQWMGTSWFRCCGAKA